MSPFSTAQSILRRFGIRQETLFRFEGSLQSPFKQLPQQSPGEEEEKNLTTVSLSLGENTVKTLPLVPAVKVQRVLQHTIQLHRHRLQTGEVEQTWTNL